MEKFEEKKISSRRVFQGRLLGLRVDTVKLANGVETTREIVEHPGAVAVVAITREKELVMVRQFRTPTGEVLLEVPAGVPHKGEKGEDTARRELEEETGYFAKKIVPAWKAYVSPGYSNEMINFYIAEDMNLMQQKPDEDELVEADLVDLELCWDLIKTGKIRDHKTIVGVLIADLYLKGEL